MERHGCCVPTRRPILRALLGVTTFSILLSCARASNALTQADYLSAPRYAVGGVEQAFRAKEKRHDVDEQLNLMVSQRQTEGPAFSLPDDPEILVALTNGSSDATVRWVFTPEEGSTIDDYTIEAVIGNQKILTNEDVSFFFEETRSGDQLAYNVTSSINFDQWTGVSTFGVRAVNQASSSVDATSSTTELVVAGVTFFTTNQAGEETIISASESPLSLSVSEIIADNNVNLDVFVQYADGSDSSSSLAIPFTGLTLSTGSVTRQIDYTASCSPTAGTFTGSDVELAEPCDMGFSTNDVDGTYVGPRYGFDLNRYENGSFFALVEWDELLQGSDLEGDGYETFLQVNINGEVPPVVYSIIPGGPFNSVGTERATFNIANLPETVEVAQTWTYTLSIDFGSETREATFDPNSIVINTNNTLSGDFILPAGVGTDLPWSLTVTKPTGEQLTAIDETSPSYLFNFVVVVTIESLTPSSGPEEGGTSVTVVGSFPEADTDGTPVAVLIDGIEIDSSLVTFVDTSSITFTLPQKPDASDFDVTITVQVDGTTSNAVSFSYIPNVRISTIAPDSGPIEGGTTVTLSGQFFNFDPSNSGIFFGETQLDSALLESFNDTTIIFATADRTTLTASDSVYTFDVTVGIDGEVSNAVQFSYDAPVLIDTITPTSGEEEGGTEVTVSGQFINFDTSTSTVVVGGKILDPTDIVSFNDSTVVFLTPPLSEAGLSYTQKVKVTIGEFASNEVEFTYLESTTTINIDGGGGNIDPITGIYRLGACSDGLFRVTISTGSRSQVQSYQWTLTEVGGGANLLPNDVTSDADVLLLPYTAFPTQNTQYTLTITVTTTTSTAQESLTVVQLSAQAISVHIVDPRARSPSDPNVSLTIQSLIGLPGCENTEVVIDSSEMTYIWEFRGETYTFSYLNTTAPEDRISPTLLGREFNIPQANMEYGSFAISLTAFFTQQDSVSGSDSSTVVINPASLVAQINGGEESQFISETQSFTLSGAQSYDPDILSGDLSTGLQYSWSCRTGFDTTLNPSDLCGDQLLPPDRTSSVDFTLSPSDLESSQNETSDLYVEYSLQVSKVSQNASGIDITRVSSPVTSTLILPQQKAQTFESLIGIDTVNNQSARIDTTSVKYYEDVTITPVSETTETTWTFRLVSPLTQTRTLLASDENLLTFPGYFTAGSEAGRLSLGIKANVLSSNTEYVFLITTFRTGFAINEHTLSLTTVEQPTVTVGSLATPTGTTNDTYVLSASTSYDADFKFFFLLTDEFGFETCVGGCQGTSFIRFRLGTAGIYTVRCDVYDSLGFTLLATAEGGNITVTQQTTSTTDLTLYSGDVDDAFVAGDHSDFQQLGTDMVKFILNNGGSSSSDLDSETIRNFTAGLNQVAANAVPNSIQSSGFVRTAAALASLTPELGIVYDTASLYFLVNITVNAVERTPDTAALQQLQDLLDFYDLTPELVLASYSGGTSRTRLRQVPNGINDEVIELWLDLYEVMKRQFTFVGLSRCTCGCIVDIRTGVSSASRQALSTRMLAFRQETENEVDDDDAQTPAANYVNPNQNSVREVRMQLGHFCNEEQGTSLVVNEGQENEIRFTWCRPLYEDTIKKLFFLVADTPNYISLSGLHTNTTLSDGLVSMIVARLEANGIADATLPLENCYEVKVPIPREVAIIPSGAPADQVPLGMLFTPEKVWGEAATRALYFPTFESIITRIDNSSVGEGSQYATAELRLSQTGVVSIGTRFAWGLAGLSLEGILLLVVQIVGVVLSILVLVVLGVVGTWIVGTGGFGDGVAVPVETDFTYVERDVYGRGTALAMDEEQAAIGALRR